MILNASLICITPYGKINVKINPIIANKYSPQTVLSCDLNADYDNDSSQLHFKIVGK